MLARCLSRVVGLNCVRMASTSSSVSRKLEGKVAVVTASTDGIGLAIARKLGQDGAKVVVSSRKQQNVDRALEQLKSENLAVSGVVCHVGKAEDRTKLIDFAMKEYGAIDILVSNAATNPSFGPVMDTTEQQWDKIFDTNVKAAFFLGKEVIPHMEERGGGAIIFVSSIGGYVPFELLGPYSVSKTALLGLVKAMAPQCARMNIRVNGLAPGLIKTRFSQAMWSNPEVEEKILENIPMGRMGMPDDIGGCASFLCSDESKYLVGETIVISGGMISRL